MKEQTDKLDSVKEQLKELYRGGSDRNAESTTDKHMKQMYVLQRQLLNSGSKLSDIQENFPYLFTPRSLLKYSEGLVGYDQYSSLVSAFQTKTSTLLAFEE